MLLAHYCQTYMRGFGGWRVGINMYLQLTPILTALPVTHQAKKRVFLFTIICTTFVVQIVVNKK